MSKPKILIVDDDETLRGLLRGELAGRGLDVITAPGHEAAIATLDADKAGEARDIDLAVFDLRLPDGDGLDLVRWARQHRPRMEVIVLTGHGTIDTAIEAMRCGAFDYLRKPCPIDELEVTIQKALEHQALVERNSILSDGLAPPDLGTEFVGRSPAFAELVQLIDRVAASDSSVLVLGETGVGKDVIAKLLHARSIRRRQPLVVVQCAALHEELLTSELFGHEKGAYTGAAGAKHGLFEVAHNGTIFLDEIGDVSPATQVKLLRVLETGSFRHVGGTREIQVDVRLIAATNRNLKEMMERGYFRSDLYYRLSTIRIDVPPLRERPEDIAVLAEHFLERLGSRFGRGLHFAPETLGRLAAHRWPGNVRELLHVVERALILADGKVVEPHHLPAEIRGASSGGAAGSGGDAGQKSLRDVEREHIERILASVAGNREQAAKILGISERTLYRKIREFDLG